MAATTYVFTVRDSTTGTRKTGLTPTWVFLKLLSDGTDVAQPDITEIAQGQYKFDYDYVANGDASGQIDAGATLVLPEDRYIDVVTAQLLTEYVAPDNGTIAAINNRVTSTNNRVGSFAGSGDNTILGAFRALMNKTSPLPANISGTDGTYDPATDSNESLSEAIAAVGASSPGTGDGDYVVNQDGGTGDAGALVTVDGVDSEEDIMTIELGGVGLAGVDVRAYVQSVYDAGGRTVFASSETDEDGHWPGMNLYSGTYTLVFSKPQVIENIVRTVVVP